MSQAMYSNQVIRDIRGRVVWDKTYPLLQDMVDAGKSVEETCSAFGVSIGGFYAARKAAGKGIRTNKKQMKAAAAIKPIKAGKTSSVLQAGITSVELKPFIEDGKQMANLLVVGDLASVRAAVAKVCSL